MCSMQLAGNRFSINMPMSTCQGVAFVPQIYFLFGGGGILD